MPHIPAVDPAEEWKRGFIGWLVRVRGIATSILTDAGLALGAFWWVHWVAGVLVLSAGVFAVVLILLLRRWRQVTIGSHNDLHAFCHQTRDDFAEIINKARSHTDHRDRLDQFHTDSVQRVATFFRNLIGDTSINCAIRLAEQQEAQEVYVTRGRSDGMDPNRKSLSKPIPANMGLANALRNKDSLGAYVIPDIEKAIEDGLWMPTKTDKLPDVKTLIVAPINGWEGGQKAMLGILYVTSRKNCFGPAHTVPLKAFADILGLVYPIVAEIADEEATFTEEK